MTGDVRRATTTVRVAAAVLLAASTLVWTPVSPVGAWSSDDGAVAAFGSGFQGGLVVDGSGNIYTSGSFETGTVDVDPGPGTLYFTSAGGKDANVVKLDSSGNLAWARHFGGTGDDESWSVAVDGSGNVHLTGMFEDTVDFDPGEGTLNLTSVGKSDVYVVKLDSSGDLVWAKSFGGTDEGYYDGDEGYSVAVDGSVVVMQPFSAVKRKQSPPALYKRIIEGLPDGTRVVITGTQDDLDANADFMPLLDLPGVEFDDSVVQDLVPLLRAARLVVSVDTALLHLAVAVGAPTLCLASAAFVGEIVPYDPAIAPDNARFVYHSMPCEGCLGDCILPAETGMFPCVARLDEDRIVAEVRSLIGEMEGGG